MKICFLVYHLRSGGAERTISYLSSYMADRGWDVTLLNTSAASDIFYDLNPKVKIINLNIDHEKGSFLLRKMNAVRRNFSIAHYLRHHLPDCLFCMLPFTAKPVLHLNFRNQFKLITSERSNPAMLYSDEEKKDRDEIFLSSDGIVFQTERARQYYPPEIRNRGVVIQNAVGNEYISRCPFPVLNRDKTITAMGRLESMKDYPMLFKAFSIVLKEFPDYTLEIFGEGSERKKLETLIADADLQKSIHLLGNRKDAILDVSRSACYVLSSQWEGMPNALMEAMAVGTPCVSTDCPNGPGELIRNGENGLLVPVGDADAMAQAILKMLRDPDFADHCGKNGRKILDTQSVDVVAKKYCSFIQKISEHN